MRHHFVITIDIVADDEVPTLNYTEADLMADIPLPGMNEAAALALVFFPASVGVAGLRINQEY